MKTLLIVVHSRTGGTQQMAEAARRGASGEAEIDVRFLQAREAQPDDVLAADGYIFATPENLAALAGEMKEFFDRTYYPVLDRINGRPFAMLICAGSDGENAARQIGRIATGWRLRRIADPLIVCTRAQTPEAILAPKLIGPADLDLQTRGCVGGRGLDEVGDRVIDGDRLRRGPQPGRSDHHRQARNEVAQGPVGLAPGADDHRRAEVR